MNCSRGLQPTVKPQSHLRREATPAPRSIPQIALVVIHLLPFQKRQELLLKRLLSMMLLLIPDVLHDTIEIGSAHCERAVCVLPREPLHAGYRVLDPGRGAAFDELHSLADRQHRRNGHGHVNMIGPATHEDGYILFSRAIPPR